MNLSGILVVATPPRFEECLAALAALPGVEVHYRDRATARAVVVQEAPSVDEETAGLLRIKSLPGVVLAEMVYHYLDEDETAAPAAANPVPPRFQSAAS